ncbi:tRNA1(Val) (adenine(37)-N6)-methyltransferase [Zavarzinia sp.]|uniref:tRNA1(Val) (adenine(37)-N6)-methyltransferase n=1 Tax=Zavarzinia sp. TaxID=2027920 RepID=UPI0035638782
MTETEDRLLGGRLRLLQPTEGYRAAIDPVLLAAFTEAPAGGSVLDLGCGTGAALLCLAARRPDLHLTGIDGDQGSLALAARSAALNGMAERVTLERRAIEDGIPRQTFDAVMTNPPYLAAGRGSHPHESRRDAHMEGGADLPRWLDEAIKALKPGGRLTLVHRADRLPEILALAEGRLGALEILPLWPKAGQEAKRVLVAGRAGRKTPARLLSGLVLHGPDGAFTPEAEAVLRSGAAL